MTGLKTIEEPTDANVLNGTLNEGEIMGMEMDGGTNVVLGITGGPVGLAVGGRVSDGRMSEELGGFGARQT